VSTNTPNHPDERGPSGEARLHQAADTHHDPLAGNPYSNQYQRAASPDLDAGAPQLKSHELRRMNQRALLLLGAVVVLLLFVAYWMLTSAGSRNKAPKPREEKVTVAEAPRSLTMPQFPQAPPVPALPAAQPQPIPLAQAPVLPPLPPREPVAPNELQQRPSLMQRRIIEGGDASGTGQQPADAGQQLGLPGSLAGARDSTVTSAQPLTSPDTLMQRGTYIRCVLETRIISDVAGFSTCLVTEPVYSFNGHRLLLPKGSKLLGSYDKRPIGNRMAVIWDRIITPTGIDVNMSSPGIDNLGGAGLPGQYNAHWAQRISSALLISLLSDAFKYEAAEHGPRSTTITNGVVTQEPFESNTAKTVQNLADQAVQEAANRPPTVTINQGTIIYVYVAKDVDFSGVVARF
jgi:type IV secretion system protein VirB10